MAEGQLSLTINRIYEELSNDESQMLIYLCSDLEGGCSKQDVKEVLKSQIKSGVVDHLVLAELLYRIKRFDLLKKILRSNKKQVEALLGSRPCTVSAYRVLMAEISEDLDKEDLHSLIFLLNDSIPKGRLDKATSFLDVVIELEKHDKVSPNKVDLIEQCLRHIHRKDLEKKVLKYRRSTAENIKVSFPVPETGMQNPGEVYRMQRHPFGVCLIIDCVGSDGDMLKHTFKRLHFQVILYKWLSLSDAYSLLKETARMREHRNSDCFVCCIISRGSSTKMIATEKEGPGISFDTIKQLFTVEHCPDLSGKPKLFFIQNYTIPERCDYNDVEVDGPFIASRVEYIPNEADVFWSCCKTDACILEKVHHQSAYLHALSASLLRGQKRKLLYELSEEMNTEDLRGMKFILDNKLKKSTLEKEGFCLSVNLDTGLYPGLTCFERLQDPPRNQERSQGSTEGQSAEEYTMSSRPHGYCLIINNFNFENTELGNRHGTDIDASALKEVFEWLGFEVRKADDVTGAGMHGILKEYQSKPHTDCFVCCILSHGEEECVLGTDGDKVFIRDLVSYFNGQNCPSLLTKPKVFFIQACQGKTNQQSVQVDGDEPGSAALESDALATPFDADRLIGMATVQDCLSFRNKQKGSWYIQALCKHLKQSCPRGEDIHAILTKVNNDVSKEQGYIRDKLMKQMPEPRHTLTKKLVFRVPVNSQP
ncbi:UNVERIFIED_CONTAM: hypothetical protein FKN15_001286 [Acipenser sinensis]